MHSIRGLYSFSRRVVPTKVPLVPNVATKCVTRPSVCRQISSGTAVVGCLRLARELAAKKENAVIVTVFPDSADKYLSERFWDEQ